jgi:hypothetical protein
MNHDYRITGVQLVFGLSFSIIRAGDIFKMTINIFDIEKKKFKITIKYKLVN